MAKIDYAKKLGEKLNIFELHPRFLAELLQFYKKTSHKPKFYDLLINRLDFLLEHGRLASENHKEFERIDEEIYSMHVVVPDLNLRILYSFQEDGTILLHAFYEREGKRKTNYTHSLPTAHRRKVEMEE